MPCLSSDARDEFLAAAPSVDIEIWQSHISSFINQFVVKAKRQRWHHLCFEKPEKGKRDALHMYGDLIRPIGPKMSYEDHKSVAKKYKTGVFYTFDAQACWLSPEDAFLAGHDFECIYSLEEGKVVIYFWHEMQEFLLQR